MQIKSIKLSNFKSFESVNMDLRKFNILIGANASGKSNFLSVFQFLKDICVNDLEDAISMQGGVDYIRNINSDSSKNLSIEVCIEGRYGTIKLGKHLEKEGYLSIIPYEWIYKFSIEFPGGKKYRVAEESLVVKFDVDVIEDSPKEKTKNGKKRKKKGLKFTFNRDKEGATYDVYPKDISLKIEDIVPPVYSKKKFLSKELSIEAPVSVFHFILNRYCSLISLYNFDPNLSKEAIAITGKNELEPEGDNLSVVLKNVLDDKKKREKFHELIKDLIPFIEEIKVEKFGDKYLLTSLKEIYSKKKFFAPLISDGTINITALIIALYFEKKPISIIEEPERNIHPYLISKIMDMMDDVSERLKRQIIVTTHNPEVVKYVNVENILLVHRDDKGLSQIIRPVEKDEVKTFLQNDLGIDELYVQNLLE